MTNTFANPVLINNTLTSTGETFVDDTLTVSDATTLKSTLDVTSTTNLGENLNVIGKCVIDDTLTVAEETTLNNSLTVNADSTLNDIVTIVTSANSGTDRGILSIKSTASSDNVCGFSVTAPNMSNTYDVYTCYCTEHSKYNAAFVGFHKISSSSASNYGFLGMYSDNYQLTWNYSGVNIQNNLTVGGTLTTTGATTLKDTLNVSDNTTLAGTLNDYNIPVKDDTNGTTWPSLAVTSTTGVTEIGRYLDWHYVTNDSSDYITRMQVDSAGDISMNNSLKLTDGDISFTANSATGFQSLLWDVGTSDKCRIRGGSTGSETGYLEIATSDDATEPIVFRQYTYDKNGSDDIGKYWTSVGREAYILNASGETILPVSLTVPLAKLETSGYGDTSSSTHRGIISVYSTNSTANIGGLSVIAPNCADDKTIFATFGTAHNTTNENITVGFYNELTASENNHGFLGVSGSNNTLTWNSNGVSIEKSLTVPLMDGDVIFDDSLTTPIINGTNGSLTVTGATTMEDLEIVNTNTSTGGDNRYILRLLKPNIATNGNVEILFGRTETSNDCGKIGWKSTGTSTGYINMNIYNSDELITIDNTKMSVNENLYVSGTINDYNIPSTTNNGKVWPHLAAVKSDGLMEIGRYIDWHYASDDSTDKLLRMSIDSSGTLSMTNGMTIDSGDIKLSSGNLNLTANADSGEQQICFSVGGTDYAYVKGGATESNKGYLEISTGDDGDEPIICRQRTTTDVTAEAYILNESGETTFPKSVTVPSVVTDSVSLDGNDLQTTLDKKYEFKHFDSYADIINTNLDNHTIGLYGEGDGEDSDGDRNTYYMMKADSDARAFLLIVPKTNDGYIRLCLPNSSTNIINVQTSPRYRIPVADTSGNLSTAGSFTAASLNIGGNANFEGDSVTIQGNATINGTLTAGYESYFNDIVKINSTATMDIIKVLTNATIDGTLNGFNIPSTTNTETDVFTWPMLATVASNGYTEIGKVLDWHYITGDTEDYTMRMSIDESGILTMDKGLIVPSITLNGNELQTTVDNLEETRQSFVVGYPYATNISYHIPQLHYAHSYLGFKANCRSFMVLFQPVSTDGYMRSYNGTLSAGGRYSSSWGDVSGQYSYEIHLDSTYDLHSGYVVVNNGRGTSTAQLITGTYNEETWIGIMVTGMTVIYSYNGAGAVTWNGMTSVAPSEWVLLSTIYSDFSESVTDITAITTTMRTSATLSVGALSSPSVTGSLTMSDGSVNVTAGDINFNLNSTDSAQSITWKTATNDYARVSAGGTASDSGYLELATADGASEPIVVRQYTGAFVTVNREAYLLNASGKTTFPVSVDVPTVTTNSMEITTTATEYSNGNDRYVLRLLAPNATSGQYIEMLFGKSETTNDCGKLGWVSTGSGSGYITLNTWSNDDLLTVSSSDCNINVPLTLSGTPLSTTLATKSDVGHTHEIADVNGLDTALSDSEVITELQTKVTEMESMIDSLKALL